MKISSIDFDFIRDIAEKKAGITIDIGKEYLVENRISSISRKYGYASLSNFISHLRDNPFDREIIDETIDALTINETSFFRDFHPFEHLRKSVIPEIIEANKGSRKLSIWSAACSTGQEIYSIAILLSEHFPNLHNWNINLYATDISNTVLERARSGNYTAFEANRGLNDELKKKYFKQDGENLELNEAIRSQVTFQSLNFMEQWKNTNTFDIILMRNVLIYFDTETKRKVLTKVKNCLSPQGHLFLGSSETTYNIDSDWVSIRNNESTSYKIDPQYKAIAFK